MCLITNIVVLYEVPNFFWFALLYYLLHNIVVGGGRMVAVGHPAAGRPSDRPEGPSIASLLYFFVLILSFHHIISWEPAL